MAKKPGLAGVAAAVLAEAEEGVSAPLPKGDVLKNREASMARFGNDTEYLTNEFVDPAICKPSAENARFYAELTYADCEDLIESIKAEGRQTEAALVRRSEDPDFEYEIVAGDRRHWAISWLRANHYPDFKYLIRVKAMDDEAAFRASDIENRVRKDLTDLERATSYKRAVDLYYGGSISQMAERLNVPYRTLHRYIDLAELPPVLFEAVGRKQVTVGLARDLKPLLAKSTDHQDLILAAASKIAEEQSALVIAGAPLLVQNEVVRRLKIASEAKKARGEAPKPIPVADDAGQPLFSYVPAHRRAGISISLPARFDGDRDALKAAVLKLIDERL